MRIIRVLLFFYCLFYDFHLCSATFFGAPILLNSPMAKTRRRQYSPTQTGSFISMATEGLESPAPKRVKTATVATVTPSPTKKSNQKVKAAGKRNKAKTTRTAGSTTPTASPSVLTSSQVAAVAPDSPYLDLQVPPAELRPSATLTTGQCFHWRVVEQDDDAMPDETLREATKTSAWGTHDSTEWVGILRVYDPQIDGTDDSIVVSIKETPDTTFYRVLHAPPFTANEHVAQILQSYFQIQTPLEPLYKEWSEADPARLKRIAECIPGVRIIEQDPWECLVSFICSSNNNIPRITKMLNAIRKHYGEPLVSIGDETLYSFPSLTVLRERASDADLREIGLGYRSKYLIQTMETLHELGGEIYLHKLRDIDDPVVVQEALLKFCGVGRKVADCTALFSLRQHHAIPIDVHVWNIARRDYDKQSDLQNVKSMTPTIYKQVGDLFRTTFPSFTGWAHSLLFVAELPSFRPVLPQDVVDEMEKFRELEQARKVAARQEKRAKKDASD